MATLSMFSMLLNVCRIQKERHVESLTAETEAVWCKYVACINVKLLKKLHVYHSGIAAVVVYMST